MLKVRIVQILFSKIHKKYAKFTLQTFTFDRFNHCLSDRMYGLNKIVLHMQGWKFSPPDCPRRSVSQSDRNETLDVSPVVRLFQIP
jgi:hypothetical protein